MEGAIVNPVTQTNSTNSEGNTMSNTAERFVLPFNQSAALFRTMYRDLSYNTIYQHLIKHITNGGTLGFNPVSRWVANGRGKDSRKYKMLQHIFNTYDHNAIIAAFEAQKQAGRVNERFRDGGGRGHGGTDGEDADEVTIDENVPRENEEVTQETPTQETQATGEVARVDMDEVRRVARNEATHRVNELRADLERRNCITVQVHNVRDDTRTDMGLQHVQFPTLIQFLQARFPVYLPGPAGSGKTTAAMNAAKAFNLSFHFNGAVDTEYKLLGFTDAGGRFHETPFYRAYKDGGVYLFDEIDASNPQALVALNAALENGYCVFGNGETVAMHPDLYIIAAANTYGSGATHEYVGRNKLDAASVDRFVMLDWGYDENLERAIAGNDEWVTYVQRVRAIVSGHAGIKHVVSPRASIRGARMLAQGIAREQVINATVRKGLSVDQWLTITRSM
jgi:cobaltochelatase CobS